MARCLEPACCEMGEKIEGWTVQGVSAAIECLVAAARQKIAYTNQSFERIQILKQKFLENANDFMRFLCGIGVGLILGYPKQK